jgi:hypothetical protein
MATDFYQLRIQGLHQTQYNECVLHFQGVNLDVANYIENAESLISGWVSNASSEWADCLPSTYQVMRLTAKKASPGGGAEIVRQFQFDELPGSQGPAAAQQLCPIIRLIPPMGIKSAGRIFMPCIAEAQIANNIPIAGWFTVTATLMNNMITGFSDATIDWKLAIHSRKNNTFAEVLNFDYSPVVGFQRRRARNHL